MNRAFLSLVCGLALIGAAFAQTGTNPGEGGQLTMTAANEYDFSWQGRVGRFYFVQQSEDLIHWTFVPGAYGDGVNEILAFHFCVSGADRFFVRLKYLEPYSGDPLTQDYDGDTVTTIDEINNGTNPFDSAIADTDMDGCRTIGKSILDSFETTPAMPLSMLMRMGSTTLPSTGPEATQPITIMGSATRASSPSTGPFIHRWTSPGPC